MASWAVLIDVGNHRAPLVLQLQGRRFLRSYLRNLHAEVRTGVRFRPRNRLAHGGQSECDCQQSPEEDRISFAHNIQPFALSTQPDLRCAFILKPIDSITNPYLPTGQLLLAAAKADLAHGRAHSQGRASAVQWALC